MGHAMSEALWIVRFVGRNFLHLLPYLAVTIPLAVYLKRAGLSKRIEGALQGSAVLSVVLATFIGAVSPFCSCGVVPVIAALLTGGVPLAPVMSFWLASPSMDPEVFFLSVGTLGWELAIWRLAATFAMSLGAGLFTLWLDRSGWLGTDILRARIATAPNARPTLIPAAISPVAIPCCSAAAMAAPVPATASSCCGDASVIEIAHPARCSDSHRSVNTPAPALPLGKSGPCCTPRKSALIARDTLDLVARLVFYMAVAFMFEAIIERYVPQQLIAGFVGKESPLAVLFATLIGIPFYTTELAALGIVSGLMAQGMTAPAALAFLIGGGVTTLPAMAAVWGIVKFRIFALYLGFCIAGSLLAGFAMQIIKSLFG